MSKDKPQIGHRESPQVRVPAEWERHQKCLLAFPYRKEEWLAGLREAQAEWLELCSVLKEHHEPLTMCVPNVELEEYLVKQLPGVATRVEAYGDAWFRDTTPVFVEETIGGNERSCGAVVFRFNGWGGKFQIEGDEDLAARLAVDYAPVRQSSLTLEGGALESNGEGVVLTTRSVLLNENRKPATTTIEDVEQELREQLGANHIIWLGDGLREDHTDGHIDNLARFVSSDTVLCTGSEAGDPNHAIHARVRDDLSQLSKAQNLSLTLDFLPSPGAIQDPQGALLPASYCNFYIGNECVVVPQFQVVQDAEALRVIGRHFPDRNVVGVPSRFLLYGGGSFHCLTRDVPRIIPTDRRSV